MSRYTNDNTSLRERALRIEHIVLTEHCDGDVDDAADLALNELHVNSNRKDEHIAHIVACRILLRRD